MSEQLTIEQFQKCLPKQVAKSVSPELIGSINGLIQNPDLCETYRENILSYTSVLKDGRYKITDYLNAVRYVSHKAMLCSNVVAWTKTFPDRYQRLIKNGSSDKDISAHVAAYNKTKLVNAILEQTMVPTWVLNSDLNQKAINVLAYEMVNSKADIARVTAAKSLYEATKQPEKTQFEIDISIREDKTISDLKATMAQMALAQKNEIEEGNMTVKQVAHSQIIEAEQTGEATND